jgi:hypothetical protein
MPEWRRLVLPSGTVPWQESDLMSPEIQFTATKESLARGHQTKEEVVSKAYDIVREKPQGRNILSLFGITVAPPRGTEMHEFFRWLIDRELWRHARVARVRKKAPFSEAKRQQILEALERNLNYYRRLLGRTWLGPATKSDLPDLEQAIIAATAPPRWNWNVITAATARQAREQLTSADYRSVIGSLERGTFANNLLRVKRFVDEGTDIQIRGCNIGRNPAYLVALQQFFGRPDHLPAVSAPDMLQVFGSVGFEAIADGPAQLKTEWDKRTVRDAFARWWQALGNPPDPHRPNFNDFAGFLRAGNIFPVGARLYMLNVHPRDALVRWLAQHKYRLTKEADIRDRFFPGAFRFSQVGGVPVDWLQDRHVAPTMVLFPPDPEYEKHHVRVH